MICNQKKIPLIFLKDVTGFMVGSRAEHGGIIKDGAKMVNAMANSVVPKFTVIIGNSYGAGNYAMSGRSFNSHFLFTWPSAKIAVMGAEQAAKTLTSIKTAKMSNLSDEKRDEIEILFKGGDNSIWSQINPKILFDSNNFLKVDDETKIESLF